ncbi:Site-specific DNA recombinase [Bradyrhizobium sp. Ghvi]|uniref:recombinase family protein n=1 Tax=Bradyrhizobium sp. Ghvi TaxID=1855319 RepID=UPI0008E14263|nr:recombinase family protein [Bradyrhizobium sp. Ghvi]SFO74216.1 Site-specific DNA recombinase [Bradyrhizobium sp. Ghvi]
MVSNGKFIAYYRVSTARQGRSGLGLEAQRAAVASYLNGGNWTIVAEFTEVESGRKSNRPELDKALAAARLHRCPLIVSKVDRLTRSVAFLSRLLEANVDMRFADLPQIEGATGRFLLQQMASVAELEAGMIAARTRAALAAAKARGKKLGGQRIRKSDGQPVRIDRAAQRCGAAANRRRALDRALDLAPTIAEIRGRGALTLQAIADALNNAGIQTPRGRGQWSPIQVRRTLAALPDADCATQ